MTPQQRAQLTAEAIRCGFDSPEPVIALANLGTELEARGLPLRAHHSLKQADSERPGARELVLVGKAYAYRIRLVSEPLSLRLEALKDDKSSIFVLGIWSGDSIASAEAWSVLKAKLFAAEAGAPEPLIG